MFPHSLSLLRVLRGSNRLPPDRGGLVPGLARRFPDRLRSFLADTVIFQTKSGTFLIWFTISVISFASVVISSVISVISFVANEVSSVPVEISSVMNEGSFVIFQISFAISVISFVANEVSEIAYRGELCRIEA